LKNGNNDGAGVMMHHATQQSSITFYLFVANQISTSEPYYATKDGKQIIKIN